MREPVLNNRTATKMVLDRLSAGVRKNLIKGGVRPALLACFSNQRDRRTPEFVEEMARYLNWKFGVYGKSSRRHTEVIISFLKSPATDWRRTVGILSSRKNVNDFVGAMEPGLRAQTSLSEWFPASLRLRRSIRKFAEAHEGNLSPEMGANVGEALARISSIDPADTDTRSSRLGLDAIRRAFEHPTFHPNVLESYFGVVYNLMNVSEYPRWSKAGSSLPIGSTALAFKTLIALQKHPDFDFSKHLGLTEKAFSTIIAKSMKPKLKDHRLLVEKRELLGSPAMKFLREIKRKDFHPDQILKVAQRIHKESVPVRLARKK